MVLRQRKDGTFENEVKKKTTKIQVWHNEDELKRLTKDQYILNQPKDSTALKQLAEIGSKLLQGVSIGTISVFISRTIIDNKMKNKRTGLEAEFI